jgi:hypothetical protein
MQQDTLLTCQVAPEEQRCFLAQRADGIAHIGIVVLPLAPFFLVLLQLLG